MKRILVLDDESDIVSAMKFVLEKKGFQVNAFDDPLLALQHLQTDAQYDIIFSDLLIPKMDGIEFCKQARKLNEKTKFCLLTAFENTSEKHDEELQVLDQSHSQIYKMKKPFDTAALLMTIGALDSK